MTAALACATRKLHSDVFANEAHQIKIGIQLIRSWVFFTEKETQMVGC